MRRDTEQGLVFPIHCHPTKTTDCKSPHPAYISGKIHVNEAGPRFHLQYWATGVSRSKLPWARSSTWVALRSKSPNISAVFYPQGWEGGRSWIQVLPLTWFAPQGRFLRAHVPVWIHLRVFKLLFQNQTLPLLFLKPLLSFQGFITRFLHPDRQEKVLQLMDVEAIKDQAVLILNPALTPIP